MAEAQGEGGALAARLFAPIAPTYERYARLLSFGQDGRWRRFLVDRVAPAPADTVLDVACGTGSIAAELVRRADCSVVGLDRSEEMLAEARRSLAAAGLAGRVRLEQGDAQQLPFADASFDHLTGGYLLRYVDDPTATIAGLARVVRPGGRMALLDFGVPPGPAAHALWRLYVGVGLPDDRRARLARLARGRPRPAHEHPGVLRPLPARAAARRLARGRNRRRAGAAPEPRRRRGRLGDA